MPSALPSLLSRLTTLVAAETSSSRCPVQHAAKAPEVTSGCPVMHKGGASSTSSAKTPAASSGCPVMKRSDGCASDELADTPLNPLNRMPATPAQQRAEGQSAALPTDRVQSTIPKGDGEDTWVYPSPQMFYNALVKKGKGGGVQEADMESVVAIHNNMNEVTWRQVLQWEDIHGAECKLPRKLVRFVGRPDELTPKATLKYYLGLASKPFDRHDWTVDRCGTHVRYIIDYYDIKENHSDDRLPKTMSEEGAVPSIYCDVRPAGDTVGQLMDRARMMLPGAPALDGRSSAEAGESHAAEAASSSASASTTAAAAAAASSPSSADESVVAVQNACADRFAALQACDSDQACAQAHIGLMLCIAQRVCAAEADAFTSLRGRSDQASAAEAEARFGQLEACVSNWGATASGA